MSRLNRNPSLHSPSFGPEAAYDTDFQEAVRAIDVLAAGVLVIVDCADRERLYDLSSLVPPYRIWVQAKSIVGDGAGGVGDGVTETDIALADLILLK